MAVSAWVARTDEITCFIVCVRGLYHINAWKQADQSNLTCIDDGYPTLALAQAFCERLCNYRPTDWVRLRSEKDEF
jgi:hypothetical protein